MKSRLGFNSISPHSAIVVRTMQVAGCFLILLLCACAAHPSGTDRSPIDISREPEQSEPTRTEPIGGEFDGMRFTITPVASYSIRAEVLSVAQYGGFSGGWQSKLSPVDLALGWGELIASGAYKKVKWSQSGRWYYFRYEAEFGHDNEYIIRQSANTHIIPANKNLAKAVTSIATGDTVELTGYLVKIDGTKDGRPFWWNSSLSREDTGDGSCEVLYLTRLKAGGLVYGE